MNEKPKILLAEDDLQLIDMYKKKFELEGFDVVLAEDGEKTLNLLRNPEIKPDIILLDVMMPKVNGIEVLKEIRENPETKDYLVVILTNLGDEATAEEIYKYGATDYIVKAETTPIEVAEKVKKLLKIYK